MYRVETVGADVDASIDALPPAFLSAFSELRVTLELAPWEVGQPYVATNSSGSRTATFGPNGRGLVLYAVIDRDRVVAIWQVTLAPDVSS